MIERQAQFKIQIADAEVIVNGLGNIDKSLINGCPNLELELMLLD